MKKLFKSLLAISLSFIIAFGSVSAFAAEVNDSILWDETNYIKAGTLAEGKNTVKIPSLDAIYYLFNAEKTGYYLMTYNWTDFSNFNASEKTESGVITEENICFFKHFVYGDADTDSVLFYLEEGETVLTTYTGYDSQPGKTSEISVEFYGETVSNLDFKGGIDYFLVSYYNIEEYFGENNPYPDYSYSFEGDDTRIVFDSGKSLSAPYLSLVCSSKTRITEGEFEVDVYFGNQSFKKTISVYPVSREITKIEVKDIEKYLDVAEAYNGNIIYNFNGMELILTYADGHTENVTVEGGESMGIDLLNGNPYYFPLDYYYSREDDGVNLIVSLANEEYIKAAGTLREATKRENRQHLNYRVYEILTDAFWDIKHEFYMIEWADSLWDFAVYLRRAIFNLADEIFYAFEEIAEEYFEYKKA